MNPDDVKQERESVPEMSTHQKDQLLAVLKYYLPREVRGKVMIECPQAYNAWMGGKYCEVRRTSDRSKLD